MATAALASLGRRHEARSEVANALLALLAADAHAHRWGGHGNRLLWEAAAGGADGRACCSPPALRRGQAVVAASAQQLPTDGSVGISTADRHGHACLPSTRAPAADLVACSMLPACLTAVHASSAALMFRQSTLGCHRRDGVHACTSFTVGLFA